MHPVVRLGGLVLRAEIARTLPDKVRGLMFRRGLDHCLVFPLEQESRALAAIHSFFVFFRFDVAWLDSGGRVVDAATVRPFSLYVAPARPARYVLEMPAGTLRRARLRIGARVALPRSVNSG